MVSSHASHRLEPQSFCFFSRSIPSGRQEADSFIFMVVNLNGWMPFFANLVSRSSIKIHSFLQSFYRIFCTLNRNIPIFLGKSRIPNNDYITFSFFFRSKIRYEHQIAGFIPPLFCKSTKRTRHLFFLVFFSPFLFGRNTIFGPHRTPPPVGGVTPTLAGAQPALPPSLKNKPVLPAPPEHSLAPFELCKVNFFIENA